MAEIRFERVKKKFGDIQVIKELNLTIHNGEFFTFVGPSGCGKSTILNMIAGLEVVSEGKIYFDGIVVNELSPRDRDVAMVFQSYALYPHMTIYENIAFPLRMKKIQKEITDSEVKRVASLLGLEDMLHRRPKELSGGQKQRVALGRAIIRRPKVFLMDEPLSNLDARLRVEMRAELKCLYQELKITTVYVTHDQAEAMSLSDRIAVLEKGEIQQCGVPLDVYKKPANIFVANFIGSPSINFVEAVVKKEKPFTVIANDVEFHPRVRELPVTDKVILGIRPEDVLVSNEKVEDLKKIAFAEFIEVEGAVVWIRLRWKDKFIKGKVVNDEAISKDSRVSFEIIEDNIHVFDEKTGIRL